MRDGPGLYIDTELGIPGRVDDVPRLAGMMLDGIDKLVEIAQRYRHDSLRRQKIETAMTDWLLDGLRKHGVTLDTDQS